MQDSHPSSGRLVIVGGPPASGRSTLAGELQNALGAVLLSPDQWLTELGVDLGDGLVRDRVERLQWQVAREMLRRGLTVVLDWGVFIAAKRDALRDGARAVGAAVELHFLAVEREVLWSRMQERERAGVPAPSRAQFEATLEELQPPGACERARFDAPGC